MANACKREKAESAASTYVKTIEKYRDDIIKNFNDMDLQNADIKDRFEEIIKEITNECNDLIEHIEGVKFN